jgi:serine protease Do
MKLFRHLFERADYYDNVLVEKYGAIWRKEEEN